MLSLRYSFSSRDFIQDSCNISAINNIRLKLNSFTGEQELRKVLKPQFDLKSLEGEKFASSCSGLSSRPPIIGSSIGNFGIIVGKYFSFNILSSAFVPPTGSKMSLTLELRFGNNSKIPSNFWIGLSSSRLDEKPSLQGIVTTRVAQKLTSISIKVVAMTPLLSESSQSVEVNMQRRTTAATFYVVMSQITTSFVPLKTFAPPFISFMSSFLAISHSSFFLLDYFISSNVVVVQWTILFASSACNMSKIQAINKSLLASNGSISRNLKDGLVQNLNFRPANVEFKLAGSCDIPTVAMKIPKLIVPKYDILSYEVPINAFNDQTDSALHIMLLLDNGGALLENSWIWYNNITRTISGFPFVLANGTYSYILRATDVDGQYVDQNISIVLNWMQPTYNFFYQVMFSYNPSLLPLSNVITSFIRSVKMYFKQSSAKNFIIFRPLFLANNRISLYFQNTSLSSDNCDVTGNNYILEKIQSSAHSTAPNQEFINFMQPNFIINYIMAGENPSCSKANRKPPYFNSGNVSITKFYSRTNVVHYCGISTLLIPGSTFIDKEEGDTRNLKLTLRNEDDTALPLSTWVALNASSQTIIAVPTDNVYLLHSRGFIQYKLVGTDSDGKSSSTIIKFNVTGPPPSAYYNVTMAFNVSMEMGYPYPFQINSLLKSIQRILTDGPNIHIRSYDVQRITDNRYLATLVWSPCHAIEGVCDVSAIGRIRSKLFSAGSNAMKANLNSIFDARFRISSVTESHNGPCSEDPPYVKSPVPHLHVTFCEPFLYQIPENTFADKQDGSTKKLMLKLLNHDGSVILSNFWMQFNSTKQQLTAVLTKEQNATSYPKNHMFILTATDRSNLSTNMTIKVTISGILPHYSHAFTIETVYHLPAPSHVLYQFAKKITDYLGGKLGVISKTEALGKNLIVSWINCSLRHNPCDVLGVKYMQDRLQASDGTINSQFRKIMEPEFKQIFLKEVKSGPCQEDAPPFLSVPFGPLTVTVCETYIAKIPENTFTDREQGNTRSLDLKVKEHHYYWIHFDAKQQEMRILLTNEIAKGIVTDHVTITLTATDLFLHEAEQRITINLNRSRSFPNHKVSMQFMTMSLGNHPNFVSTYDAMRKRIIAFFQGNSALTSLQYESLPSQVQLHSVLTAEWSSCSLPLDKCEISQINRIKSLISRNHNSSSGFFQALRPEFKIISVNTTFRALCKDEISTPIVQNSLAIIDITFCGYKIYRIPANTFYDKIDGNTRNMTLTILNGSGETAAESWFDFDSVHQSIRILLSSKSFPNVMIPSILTYKLKATTKRGTSAFDDLQFRISNARPNASFAFQINFVWQQVDPPSNLAVVIAAMNRISAYLERTPDDFHVVSKDASSVSNGEYFIINIANCSTRNNHCDRGMLLLYSQKIHDVTGVKKSFKQAMGREIVSMQTKVNIYGPCMIYNSPPQVVNPPSKLEVPLCSDFNYTIPATTFYDKEQSSLRLSITEIDGMPANGTYRWVSIDPSSNVLYGFISDTVLINKPATGYNLTIRATDDGRLFTETYLILDISGSAPQKLYQFTMTLVPSTSGASFLLNQVSILRLLNSYFKAQFAHLISAVLHSDVITARYSICPLPNRCDESLAYYFFSRIVTSTNVAQPEFAAYFVHKFTISTVSVFRNPSCQAAINAPIPSRLTWEVTVSYCSGFRYHVPADMFYDKEDGSTRNLQLSLRINATNHISYSYWVQLNKTTQEIYGHPTRKISLGPPINMLLFAKDSTGQEANLTVRFAFTSHPEPKYIYSIAFQKAPATTFLDDFTMFSSKLRTFLNDNKNTSFGLIRYSHSTSNTYHIDYANCSVTYDPCDFYALSLVKNRLLRNDQFPTNAFKAAMYPINISYGHVEVSAPCLGNESHPPTLRSQIKVLNIPVWSMFAYQIPANTFYDTEDGNTRNLALRLIDKEGNAMFTKSWLNINFTTQTITGFGYASLALMQPPSGFSFSLVATDSSNLSTVASFHAKIYGPAQLLKDSQIQMLVNTSSGSKVNTNVIMDILERLASYFSFKLDNIGLVDFIRHDSSQFTLSWSFVSNAYHTVTPSSPVFPGQIDYKGLITNVLTKLFLSDRKTVKPAFYSAFVGVSIISVKTAFSGMFQNIPPLPMAVSSFSFSIPFGGYRKEAIQPGWFYDFEEGNAFNMKLYLLTANNSTVSVGSWANIDSYSKLLLFSMRDSQRYSSQVRFTYYLKAFDSGGKGAVLPIFAEKTSNSSRISQMKITFEFTVAPFQIFEIFVNQSIFISDVTAQLYSLGSGLNIITNKYSDQYGPLISRSFTWQPNVYQDCSSSEVLKRTKEAVLPNSPRFKQFKLPFLPQFDLQRVYYSSSCETPGMAPLPSSDVLELNITMCSPLVYKLPLKTFVDSIDGNILSLRIRLLGEDKRELSSNSWILLNSATLQLYAIYQDSILFSKISSNSPTPAAFHRFILEATNSRGLKNYKSVKVTVLEYPHTSDCYATINVQRMFGPSEMTRLDVLYRLIVSISNYYNDAHMQLKIHKFVEKSPKLSYQLIFSNCSFVFDTMKRAREGLDESYRTSIASIFSQMVHDNGTMKKAFKRFLSSSGFDLKSVNVNYSCIEAPPYSKTASLIRYAYFTLSFNDVVPFDIFGDARDGFNLALSLRYVNGTQVSPDEWLQLNQVTRTTYGSVTVMQSYVSTYKYLLVATDSSYRTANISYTVRIANSVPNYNVTFYLGFTSTFTRFSVTANVLRNFTMKIAKYLGNESDGSNIVIDRYQSFSSISWIYSQLNCNPLSVEGVIARLQKTAYKPMPSDALKAALGPEFLAQTIAVDGSKCLEPNDVKIIANNEVNINSSLCGYTQYQIPVNVFSSSLGETTRELLLTLTPTTESGPSVGSVVQFSKVFKYLGIVAVKSRISQSLTYRLEARSQRSSSASASTVVRVNFSEYQQVNAVQHEMCILTINVTTRYNPSISENEMLQKLIEKLAKYLGTSQNQIQIMSYKRYWTYPVKLTIQFTQCGWATMILRSGPPSLYFHQLNTITEKLFHAGDVATKSPKREFLDSLKPDFNIESVERNETTCKIPPNRPPIGRKLGLVLAPSCGEFNYQVPADLFADEDGNTRKLRTQLHQSEGTELAYDSWVVYDNKTQTISGLPTDEILSKQPLEGYQYRIVATDMQNLSSFVSFKIKIDGISHASSTGTLMNLSFESAIEPKFKTNAILGFTRKLSSYKVIKDPQNRFRIKSAFVTASNVTLSLANCTPCSVEAAVKYYEVSRKQSDLQNHMSPEFPVLYSVKAGGSCSPLDGSYNNIVDGSTQNVTFCKRTRINLFKVTGVVGRPPDTKFIIAQVNMTVLPQDSWFWLNETSSVIEAFPSETIWKQERENDTKYLLSIAAISTNTRLSSFLVNSLHIVGIPPRSGFPYTITFSSKFSSNQADAFYISLIYDQLALYFGREDFQHVSFDRKTGNLFTWNFFICGLPFNCTDQNVVSLNSKIYQQSKVLRSEFKAAFTNEISILSMSNKCTNNPPEILKPNLNLSVPFCGLYRYQIPSDFAMDKEDGDTRSLMVFLRASDGGFLPRDSWIQLNSTSQEIYAFPLEGLSKVPQLSGWEFLLIVRDNDGAQVQTELKIFVQQGQTPFYSLNFTFETMNRLNEMSFLDIQASFLSLVSSLFFDSSLHHYKVLSFQKIATSSLTSETFKIRFSNCSIMKYICRKAETQLVTIHERMISSSVENSSLFDRFIEHNFQIKDVKIDSHYSIDKKPVVVNAFDTIRLKICGSIVREIPDSVFYDAEEAELGNLTKRLVFENSSYMSSDYWVQMLNEKVYVVPYGFTESGTYSFRLVATDVCGQSVSTPVRIILKDEPLALRLEINMIGTLKYIDTKPNVFYVAQMQEKIRKGLEGSINRARIASFERENDVFKVKWQKCVATCNGNSSKELKRMVYHNAAFKDSFLPTFSIRNITDNGLDACFQDFVTVRNISITVGICEKLNFYIPRNIFLNITDGSSKLQLLNNSKLPVSKREWLQYNEVKQSIYGYPRILDQSNMQRIYNYYLLVTDVERNTKLTALTVEILGENPIVTQMFTISGETDIDQESPLILQEVTLINKIGSFFGNFQINNMKYNRNGMKFSFGWSFCNMTSDVCDCDRIRSIRENAKNIDLFKLHMQPEFNIKNNIEEKMLGICEKEQIPLVSENQTDIVVLPGEYFSMEINERKFRDTEDGYTRNLTVYLASTDNVKFGNSWWIKIQNYELCGLITLYESLQINSRKSVYKAIAQDRCGNEAVDSYNVTVLERVPKLNYKVTVYLNGSFGVNCTKTNVFTKRISSYIGMPESKIYIYNYTNYNETEDTSVVTWGVTNITEQNCTNGTIRELTEKFLLPNGSVNAAFIKYMETEYLVILYFYMNCPLNDNCMFVPLQKVYLKCSSLS